MKGASAPRWLPVAAAAAGVVLPVWAWWLERPPAPLGADAPAQRFSAERAVEQLEQFAVRPHMTGSEEHARVREYLVGELRALGFETEVQQATVVTTLGGLVRAATVRNIVARRRGVASTGGVALASHYDSQQLTPGAGDDGAGIAATLEALRALNEGEPLRNDLYVVITDAEELGLLGARAFVDEHRWWPGITVLLSFEARGAAGPSVMFETNDDNGWVVRELARADPYPSGSSLYYEVYRRLPNDTDFSVYKRAGAIGLNFALAERADVYHRPADSIENLSRASLQHHGEHALALSRHFGELDLEQATTAPNAVFFHFPGIGLVSYPFAWVGVLSLLAVVFAGAVVERGFRRRRLTVTGVLAGLGMSVAGIALAAGGGWVLWLLVRPWHHELGSLQGRAFYSERWYGLAIAALAIAAVAAALALARRRFALTSLVAGALLGPIAVALVTWWYAPGVSMLLLWPVVLATGALAYLLSRPAPWHPDGADLAALVVLSAPVVLLLFPLAWTVYAGLSVAAAPLLAGCIALMLVLLLPLLELAGRPHGLWLPAAALGLMLAFTTVGIIDARPGAARPRPSDLVYVLDREDGSASWATMQPADDGWIERFVPAGAASGDLAPFLAGNRRPYRLAPALALNAPRAAVRVIDDAVNAGTRRLRLEIESAVAPELLSISPGRGSQLELIAINDVAVPRLLDAGARTGWLLQHFGTPPGGVLTVELRTDPRVTGLELALVEFLMRLPPVAGVDTERPPGWVAHAGRLSDVSMFRQVIAIE